MTGLAQRIGTRLAVLALMLPGGQPGYAQSSDQNSSAQAPAGQVSATPQGGYVLKMNGELVLTNVVARDSKTGEVVKGLKQSDFSIYEAGKQQPVDTFDFESVEQPTPLNEATVSGLATATNSKAVAIAKPEELRNHRLIVMFF